MFNFSNSKMTSLMVLGLMASAPLYSGLQASEKQDPATQVAKKTYTRSDVHAAATIYAGKLTFTNQTAYPMPVELTEVPYSFSSDVQNVSIVLNMVSASVDSNLISKKKLNPGDSFTIQASNDNMAIAGTVRVGDNVFNVECYKDIEMPLYGPIHTLRSAMGLCKLEDGWVLFATPTNK